MLSTSGVMAAKGNTAGNNDDQQKNKQY